MPLSTDKMNSYITACAVGSPSSLQNQQLNGAIDGLNSAAVGYSVSNLASLPAAECNIGRFVFVEDCGAYRYSDGSEWTNSYDTTLVQTPAIYSIGQNKCGEHATNDVVNHTTIQREFTLSCWSDVVSEECIVGGLKTDGTIWSWGKGALFASHGNNLDYNQKYSSPVQEYCSATNWCLLNRDNYSTVAIKTDGTLWGWGYNFGNLMLNTCGFLATGYYRPYQEYTSSTNWCYASPSASVHYGIKTDGTMWVAGCNFQNGRGMVPDPSVNLSSPVQEVSSSTNWCYVGAGGHNHIAALKTDGTLWSAGCYANGGLGINDAATNVSSPVQEISSSTNWCTLSLANLYRTNAIKTDGTLWGWGLNVWGPIGDGTTLNRSSPVQEISSSTNWCYVAAGAGYTTKAIKTDGTLWGWGLWCCCIFGADQAANGCASSPVCINLGNNDWTVISRSGTLSTTGIRTLQTGFSEP